MRFDLAKLTLELKSALKIKALDQVQVDTIAAVISAFDQRGLADLRWLSYILATAWHEARFRPVREVGRGKGRKYGKPDPRTGQTYYGRGLVQLTWYDNYLKFQKTLGIPLVNNPDLALEPATSVAILIEGMTTGINAKDAFTGFQLEDCFNNKTDDPIKARRIINGTDKAKTIAGYHYSILRVLEKTRVADTPGAVELPEIAVIGGGTVVAGVAKEQFSLQPGFAIAIVLVALAITAIVWHLRRPAPKVIPKVSKPPNEGTSGRK